MMKKFLLFAAALLGAAGVFAAPESQIVYPEYAVLASGGDIIVRDYEGTPVLKIGKLDFAWSSPVAVPVRVEQTAKDTFKIVYRIDRDDSGKVALEGTLRALPDGHIRLDWRLDAPEPVKTGGIMLELLPLKGTEKSAKVYKSGLWTRHEHGGIPFEVRDGYFRSFRNENTALWLLLGGNANYSNGWSEHPGFTKKEDGKFTASLEFLVCAPELEDYEAVALFHKRPLGLRLSTEKPFNLWESGSPELKVQVSNPYNRPKQGVAFEIIGRDFDGKTVLKESKQLTLKPFETKELTFRLPEAERTIYFVEAKAVVPGEKEIFSRTNLAILPPHEYRHRRESKFALSAYFMIPSEKDVYALMQRMGVRVLRHGDNRVTGQYGILALDHASIGPDDSPAQAAKRIGEMVRRAAERRNPEIEFCNEWNMHGHGRSRHGVPEAHGRKRRGSADGRRSGDASRPRQHDAGL